MRHVVFGDLSYEEDAESWIGYCPLPAFAKYGKTVTEPGDFNFDAEEDANFRKGVFRFAIQDEGRYRQNRAVGPSTQQANSFRYLQENEKQVCEAVMTELLKMYQKYMGKGWIRKLNVWLRQHDTSRLTS